MGRRALTATPPGPRGYPVVGCLPAFFRDRPGFLLRTARRYGDLAFFRLGPRRVFLLSHPDQIRDVLVTSQRNFIKGRGLERAKRLLGEGLITSEGEFHQRQRRLAQPAFHRTRYAGYAQAIVEQAVRTRSRWRDGAIVDARHEMTRLTLAIVGKTLFGTDVEDEARKMGSAMSSVMAWFWRFTLPFADALDRLPLPATRRFRAAQAYLNDTVRRMIDERRRSGEDRGDLLSMLLLAQDEAGDGTGMTDEQVRDEALTLFLAGHETMANALTWTWYLLAQHPEVERRLHEEIDASVASAAPSPDDFERLPYTRAVLAEALRLYPPVWLVVRRPIERYAIAGHVVPPGDLVFLSQYVVHHDPRFFPDPFRFDPERWRPEDAAGRPKFSYFPFGGGPRLCIGEGFAWMEGMLVLATLAGVWRLRSVPGRRVELEAAITLRPKHGLPMTLERRM